MLYSVIYSFDNHLEHHGVLGMKWGVWNEETRARRAGIRGTKRYRTKEGKLTEAGKRHYSSESPASIANEINKDVRKIKKEI